MKGEGSKHLKDAWQNASLQASLMLQALVAAQTKNGLKLRQADTKAQTRKTKIEKWDCIRWKIFSTAKEIKSQHIAFNRFWKDDSHVKFSYHRNKRKQIKPKGAGGNLEVMDMFITMMMVPWICACFQTHQLYPFNMFNFFFYYQL